MKLLFLSLFFYTTLIAQIIETPHFHEITSYIDKDTLVLLDIDDTLLIPNQMLGCDEWFNYRWKKYIQEGLDSPSALEKSLAEWEAVRHLTKMTVVEPGTEKIVSNLQRERYTVMGLTTQGVALATRTSQQLKENGIDLSLAAPRKDDHYLTLQGHGVLYRNGILFTSGKPKGRALFMLCEKMGFSPKRIVFINDKATHLRDIEEEATKQGVEFIGLRYAYSDKRKALFRPEIAEYQFKHSTLNRLLSDEEALKNLNS